MYKLFLDDEREPVDDSWVIVRSYTQAVETVTELGFPAFISFDHDLGSDSQTGYDFAKWLVDEDIKFDIISPTNFGFFVHSQNPIGKANIEGLFKSYLRVKHDE